MTTRSRTGRTIADHVPADHVERLGEMSAEAERAGETNDEKETPCYDEAGKEKETKAKAERQRRKVPTFAEIRATVKLLSHEERSELLPTLKADLLKDIEEESERESKLLASQQERVERLNKLKNL
jgi:ribosomal protein L39E